MCIALLIASCSFSVRLRARPGAPVSARAGFGAASPPLPRSKPAIALFDPVSLGVWKKVFDSAGEKAGEDMEGFVRGQIKTVLEKAFKISESDTAEPSVTFVTMKIFEIAKAVDRMDRIEKTLNETAATLSRMDRIDQICLNMMTFSE